jgi:hypothetical protein
MFIEQYFFTGQCSITCLRLDVQLRKIVQDRRLIG